ncbi:MAG: hypothetical protein ACK4M6_12105 [Hyphomonas sp.]
MIRRLRKRISLTDLIQFFPVPATESPWMMPLKIEALILHTVNGVPGIMACMSWIAALAAGLSGLGKEEIARPGDGADR